ncbi:hypothetical protein D3C71_1539570 [compost metagenome]
MTRSPCMTCKGAKPQTSAAQARGAAISICAMQPMPRRWRSCRTCDAPTLRTTCSGGWSGPPCRSARNCRVGSACAPMRWSAALPIGQSMATKAGAEPTPSTSAGTCWVAWAVVRSASSSTTFQWTPRATRGPSRSRRSFSMPPKAMGAQPSAGIPQPTRPMAVSAASRAWRWPRRICRPTGRRSSRKTVWAMSARACRWTAQMIRTPRCRCSTVWPAATAPGTN